MSLRRAVFPILSVLALVPGSVRAADIPISGRVLGPGGVPFPNAQVVLVRAIGAAAQAHTDRDARPIETVAKAVSTAQGFFQLSAPGAGLWIVRVEAPGFAPREFPLHPLLDAVDLPELTLAPDVGLAVHVTDRDGRAAGGAVARLANVRPRRLGQVPGWIAPDVTVHTASDGVARFSRADGDRTALTVSAPGFLVAERRDLRGTSLTVRLEPGVVSALEARSADGTPAPGVLVASGDSLHPIGITGPDGRAPIPVPPKGELVIDLIAEDGRRLRKRMSAPTNENPGPVRVTLPDRFSISGRVIDLETRRPIAGALVWPGDDQAVATTTNDGGGFVLPVAPGGMLGLLAGAPGYLTSEPRAFPSSRSDNRPTLALAPAAAIEGSVVDPQGRPISGARLRLAIRPESGGMRLVILGTAPAPSAVIGARGQFRLSPVDPEKRWTLEASATGFAPASRQVAPLEPRGTLRSVRVELSKGRTLVGQVVDVEGKGIEGASARLRVMPKRSGAGRVIRIGGQDDAPQESVATSASDGRFRLDALPSGTFSLELRRSGFARKTLGAIEVPDRDEPVDLGSIPLEPGQRVQGRVTGPGGNAIEGVEVSLARNEGIHENLLGDSPPTQPEAVTTPDGWFVVDDLPRGQRIALTFSHSGYLAGREAGIELPRTEPMAVVLHPASRISGRVLDPDGKPVPLAQLTLEQRKSGGVGGERMIFVTRQPAIADGDGSFLFEDIAPGKVTLSATAIGWQEAKIDSLDVPEGKDVAGVELRLQPGAVIEGRVLAPDGRPAIGAEVGKVREGDDPVRFREATTDGDGAYRIDGLAPGPVSVEATHESGSRVVKDVDARAGVNHLDLQFQGGQEVSGRVTDASGAAIAGAWVSLTAAGRSWGGSQATAGPDGTFRIQGVGDGDYTLSAGQRGYATSDPVRVQVAAAPVTGLEVRLPAGTAIYGTITGLDPEKLAQVEIRAGGDGARDAGSSTQADREGRYRIEDLGPGRWTVVAFHPPSGEQARGDVVVPPGSTEVRLDLEFGGGLTLSGRVVQGDAPVKDADLFAMGTDVNRTGRSRTDFDGRFSIRGLAAGNYRVELNQWETGLSYDQAVEVSASREIVIRVPIAHVSGRVVDSADRRPIAGARVAIASQKGDPAADSGFGRAATTDLDGRFEISSVPDGEWRLTASRSGYAASTASVTVQGGQDVDDRALALDPTEGLTLEIRLPSGRPPDEVFAAVLDDEGNAIVSGGYSTGEGGRVRLASVPPGSWEVLVGAGGCGTVGVRATSPGEPVLVALPPSTTLSVAVPALADSTTAATATIATPDGRPFRDFHGFGEPAGQWRVYGGRLDVEDLPPGSWTVTVSAVDGRSWKSAAETAPAAPTSVVMR